MGLVLPSNHRARQSRTKVKAKLLSTLDWKPLYFMSHKPTDTLLHYTFVYLINMATAVKISFSHTTESHAKPTMQPDLYYINTANQYHHSTKKSEYTAHMKFSLDKYKNNSGKIQPPPPPPTKKKKKKTCRAGGRGRSGNGGRQQKQLNPKTPCDLKTPAHSNPYSQPCVGKTFSASFVPQPAENHLTLLVKIEQP